MAENRDPKPASAEHVEDMDDVRLEAAQDLSTHQRRATVAMNSLVVRKVTYILEYEINHI
jgi:hypothetical protein